MKIKNIILAGVALSAGFIMASCDSDDDFLKEKPLGEMTVENGYSTSDQVFATLVTAYNSYENFQFATGFGPTDLFHYKALGTDIMDTTGRNGNFSDFTTWASTSNWVLAVWDQYYKIISYCNLALNQVENVNWTDQTEKEMLISEARFLRGLAYLKLGSYFGGVPLVEDFSESPRFDYTRASREETFQFAITDLETAYKNLPDYPKQIGRVGKGAAALSLAQAYLAQGVETQNSSLFTSAAECANAVIKLHPMMVNRFGTRVASAQGEKNGIPNARPDGNVYFDLFVPANQLSAENTECVWIMACSPDYATMAAYGGKTQVTITTSPAVQDMNWDPKYYVDGAGDGPWKVVGPKYGGKVSPAIHGGMGWGSGPTTWYASVDMWDAEHNNNSDADFRYIEGVTVRSKYLCCAPNHPLYEQYVGWEHINKADELACSKYCSIFYKQSPLDAYDTDPTDPGLWGNITNVYKNAYMARSSEAYLLLAEAKLRSGDNAAALEALNTVRTRSNATPMNSIDIQTILDERARELLFEEDRWATFLRMEPEVWQKRVMDYGMYSATDGRVYPEVRRWARFSGPIKFKYWPIPQNYIDLNTGADFPQNEGW